MKCHPPIFVLYFFMIWIFDRKKVCILDRFFFHEGNANSLMAKSSPKGVKKRKHDHIGFFPEKKNPVKNLMMGKCTKPLSFQKYIFKLKPFLHSPFLKNLADETGIFFLRWRKNPFHYIQFTFRLFPTNITRWIGAKKNTTTFSVQPFATLL